MWGIFMKYKKTLFGILIVCVGLFFIIWINSDKNHDPDSIYWAKEEFENEWEDQDYYERDNSQQNAREIGQTNETVVPVEKVFYTYEDVYVYYDMLDQKKDELYKKLLSIYIIGNPHKLYHEGYAAYLGNLGRSLIFECQRFQSVKYSGTGNHNLENHIFKYHYFYGSNECYYVIGNELIKIEDNLNQEKYDEVSKSMEIIHENIKQIEVIRREA